MNDRSEVYTVQLDTASSDLWVKQRPDTQLTYETNTTLGIEYVDSAVSGTLVYADLELAGCRIPDQGAAERTSYFWICV